MFDGLLEGILTNSALGAAGASSYSPSTTLSTQQPITSYPSESTSESQEEEYAEESLSTAEVCVKNSSAVIASGETGGERTEVE